MLKGEGTQLIDLELFGKDYSADMGGVFDFLLRPKIMAKFRTLNCGELISFFQKMRKFFRALISEQTPRVFLSFLFVDNFWAKDKEQSWEFSRMFRITRPGLACGLGLLSFG